MNKSIQKEKKKRFLFLKYEQTRILLKAISSNLNFSESIRQKAALDLNKLPKDSSKVRFRNRCALTGRGRFILSSFSLSRLMLRKLACEGMIPGLRKASW
jgi:small subunit ribosomal protein S14